jgi:thiamine-monophosphate kinase
MYGMTGVCLYCFEYGNLMPLSEFEIIARYFNRSPVRRKDILVGIGDDGAILHVPPEMDLVVSIDTLVAGVHFSEDFSPEDIGYRALAVNLSDLAAMGAEPAWATLALTLPAADEAWLEGFSHGFFELARTYSVELVGGNIARGPLNITIEVHGFVPKGAALLRSGARPGDAIYVTGTLGDAALALTAMESLNEEERRHCLARLRRPSPRVEQGIKLRGAATSAIDISDGLWADLGHICEASGVGATIDLARLPLSPALRRIADEQDRWQLALTGGDDYELCFSVPSEREGQLKALGSDFGCPLTRIGYVEREGGLRCRLADGSLFHPVASGYRHF